MMVAHQICKASAPKYALGLKIREPLFWKRTFLFISLSKSATKPHKSVAKCIKMCGPLRQFGGRIHGLGGRKCVAKWRFQQQIQWLNFESSKLQFLSFCGSQLHELQWISPKITWEMPTKRVMTEYHQTCFKRWMFFCPPYLHKLVGHNSRYIFFCLKVN